MATSAIDTVNIAGNDMRLHTARPDEPGKKPAMIVIQEIFGVAPHIEDVALRFAAAGYVAVAPELFHRSGAGTVIPYGETDRAFGERGKLSNDDIVADLNATVAYLKSQPDVDSANIGIVGFCFGGFVSYYSTARIPEIKAAAVFYGGGILPRPGSPADAPRALDLTADDVDAPMIGFWGNDDGGIPPENVTTIESTLKAKGKDYESHSYDGAGHGFFCNDRPSYNETAANDAWLRTVTFFAKHLK
jgi:carboxymethylenebutenolidase